jgi:hypothetical protein
MSSNRAVELILDASSSMNDAFDGSTRIVKAKEVLVNVVENDLPDGTMVAFRVFGTSSGCSTELKVPFSPLNRKALKDAIEGIQAVGKTQIAGSLDLVKDDLANATGKRYVVLVTDGIQTCPGNVEDSIKNLKDLGIDLRLDVIGITQDPQLEEKFKSWAESCGGAYVGAHDSNKLHEALKDLFSSSYFPIDPGTEFEIGKRYFSTDKTYFLIFQDDGNFCVYKVIDDNNIQWVWDVRETMNKAYTYQDNKGGKAIFQTDGNLVIYTKDGQPTWATMTNGRVNNRLHLDPNDGTLSITDQQGSTIWSSKSNS